jgi:membrane protein DedA with SNARE-associated domain
MESFLTSAGYAGLILFAFLEAACIPISSEITFGFAGVLAYQGNLNLALVIILGTLAELAGSYASYAVGRVGGKPLVHRLGRYVLVTESDVDRAERFLEGRGGWAIVVGRMLPFVRAFISIVAGLVRVPPIRFGILSLIGTAIYATALASIGYAVGSEWQSVSHGLAVVGYILFALIVIAIVGFVAYRWRQFRREARLRGTSSLSASPDTDPGPDRPESGGPVPGASLSGGPAPGAPFPDAPFPDASFPGGPAQEDRPKPRSHRA